LATVLITGCNRGIGLQLCKQFAERGDDVIGACRESSEELDALSVRVIPGIDVGDDSTMAALKEGVGDQSIDIVLNNAGICLRDDLDSLDYESMLQQFRVNTLGPLRVTKTLLDNLSSGSKVIIITSRVGSIEDNSSGGYYGYRASKTAVNQVGMNLKHDLEPRGIAIALLHPGYVATDMTDGQGVAPEDSAKGLINRIDDLTLETSGGFWHAEGYELPW
jgi:NAD(P)-dependent dehydrogenase (short-subunit alcohol dehydrogenase family)